MREGNREKMIQIILNVERQVLWLMYNDCKENKWGKADLKARKREQKYLNQIFKKFRKSAKTNK
jgi:hypothetical protein